MIMRSAKVPLSPSSALQTMYFWSALVSATVFHLMPVGKARAAAAAQAGLRDFLDDAGRVRERLGQALVAAVGLVIVERARIDNAAAREGQARLLLQERMLFRHADAQFVIAAVANHRVEHASTSPSSTGP